MARYIMTECYENSELGLWSKIACGSAICGVVIMYLVKKHRQKTSLNTNDFPPDTVILHQIGRGPFAPSLSPFPVKLETYLRMAKIPYQNVHERKLGPKGKVPWMEYNGKIIADSQFCIDYLNKTRKINLNSHLSAVDKAIARAIQKMLEENTYWTLAVFRWILSDIKVLAKSLGAPYFSMWYFGRIVKNYAHGQGMGRHTEEEVYGILMGDLRAVSTFLGRKKFLFGDQPCETDCAVFGMLSVPYYHCFGNRTGDAMKTFPNLCEYCDRMRTTFWPDWNECITRSGET